MRLPFTTILCAHTIGYTVGIVSNYIKDVLN